MIYGSVCSGIESATVAWHPLGWRAAFFAEIEPFPSAVLAHHYPDIANRGDITRFMEWPDAAFDVLVGGTPCQSFSVAGLRAGLDDPRGNLMFTYLAIAKRYRPTWMVWENVPGILSSGGGRDFGTFLGVLGKLGYGWAYRVLDAQYFNLAQRRARVFVVGCLGGWQCAAAVLFERASMSGDPAPSRKARKDVAGTIAGGARKRGGYSRDDIPHVAFGGNNTSGPIDVAAACNAHGGSERMDFESETFIAHSLRADGFDASEEGTGRGTPIIPICFDETQITSAENRCNPQAGDPSHPLAAGARPPTIAFDCKASGRNGFGTGEIAPEFTRMTATRLDAYVNLKQYWGVSIASLIKKAETVGKIDANQKKWLYIQMSKLGIRNMEPAPVAKEQTSLFPMMVDYFRNDMGFNDDEFGAAIIYLPERLKELYDVSSSKKPMLRVVR